MYVPAIYCTHLQEVYREAALHSSGVPRIVRGAHAPNRSQARGKSTYAKTLGGKVFSTDDYFIIGGRYIFNPRDLARAHEVTKQIFASHSSGTKSACARSWPVRLALWSSIIRT